MRFSQVSVITGTEKDFLMNDSEMRRRELLRQTRKLYDSLYDSEEEEQTSYGNSFYIRLVIGILCFVCFVYMDQSKVSVAEVDSTAIVHQIEKNVDADTIKEVWKNL